MKTIPLITFGIVSCNRLYYLRALIESAKICVTYPNCEWIVVDNASTESGIRDYLNSEKLIDKLIIREKRSCATEHMDALNTIIEEAKGDFIIILSDDVQFIRKNWEQSFLNLLLSEESITSISLSALRKVTLRKIFHKWSIKLTINMMRDFMKYKKIRFRNTFNYGGELFYSFGSMRDPIDGVGMLIFSRLRLWKELGKWETNSQGDLNDSSSGGEDNMLKRALGIGVNGHMVTPHHPIIATIVTDLTGLNARVRGNIRYGQYFPPKDGNLYYKIQSEILNKSSSQNHPLGFEDVVNPLGYILPIDKDGNLVKGSMNLLIKNEIQ